MSSEDKKFSLDELPDEGSEPKPKAAPKKSPNIPEDARVVNLKKLVTDKERLEMMDQSWVFDSPEYSFAWIPWATVLIVAEYSGYFVNVREDLRRAAENPFAIGADTFEALISVGTLFLKHPIILLVLTPLFFRFKKRSDYYFEVKFDGISTLRKYIPLGSKEIQGRTFIKWDAIGQVTKVTIDGKEILRLSSADGHIGDLIWYMEIEKKRALKLLLSGMISPKNPLRAFLSNEKELK